MSEVTKLYENAGIEQTQDITCGDCEFVNYPEENKPCNTCTQYGIKHHPPFTAEKQIELIKWLAETGDVCRIDATVKNKWFVENEVTYGKCFAKFEEALANVINIIWEYMPDEEKQQVKGILE